MPVIIEFSRCIDTYSSAKFEIIRSLTIICASVILISCKSSNNEQENGNLSSAQIMTQSESDEAVSEMASTDSRYG